MSDDERELEQELDSENEDDLNSSLNASNLSESGRRAHHNALERKRRDHIKDSFNGLKDAIPTLQGDKSSRAQILKKASEYIAFMRRKNGSHATDIEDLRKQNSHLETQIKALERAKSSGNFSGVSHIQSGNLDNDDDEEALEDKMPSGPGEPLKKKAKM